MIRITTKSRSQGEEQVSKTHTAGLGTGRTPGPDRTKILQKQGGCGPLESEDPSAFTNMGAWYLAQAVLWKQKNHL